MGRSILLVICIFSVLNVNAQKMQLDSVGTKSQTNNIYSTLLAGDSLANSFCIVIKKEVKPHRHLYHSEHVLVLEGEGLMRLGDSTFRIRRHDLIFIPKNTVHSVKTESKTPLKVLSIQAPYFDGKDRVME